MLRRLCVSADPVDNLQLALAIEVAVLPPYLYACWSIKPPSAGGSEAAAEASRTIRSVMYQEMLHVAAFANILNALGERPSLTESLIKYPGNLPGHVTAGPYAFTVGLRRLSSPAIDTFTKIELPEWQVPEPGPDDDWITTAAFYDIIKRQLADVPDDAFRHGRQLPPRYNPAPGSLQPVRDRTSALVSIDAVVRQGEGHHPKNPDAPTPGDENDGVRDTAHYYQFMTVGSYLVVTPPAPAPYIVPERDLYAVIDNPDESIFSNTQKQLNLAFNQLWSELLDGLQFALASANPKVLGAGTRLMVRLEHAAAMLRNAGFVPGTQCLAGPTFGYRGVGTAITGVSRQGV
jgi:hypothetical protein